MKIALLGYGKEGKSAEAYFKNKYQSATFDIFENETPEQLSQHDYSSYDIIFRSPSIPPLNLDNESSLTRHFFDHCPCPIIGVTATKGKGTTCSFIKALLDAENRDAYLVGNIGTPAIEVLDQLTPESIVVYEMSSFQLWDLKKSPHVAVIGQLEPDHLNVHKDYQDYLDAKANITKYQTEQDYLIYYAKNPETTRIAETSQATKLPYPFEIPDDIKAAVKLPGIHNQENAIAAIAAVAASKNISPDEYLATSADTIKRGLSSFHGLPHRLEFVRELNNVKYYDDNFATNASSTRVAVNSFLDDQLVLIVGGRDKTDNQDLPEIYEILQSPNIKKIVLLGESGHVLAEKYSDPRFVIAESLEEAVDTAKTTAEALGHAIVLMSPAAASFDMFKDVYDRGDQYQTLVKSSK
ncbi:MAG: UDP-N-acetylmuramoyl-L-alanine--D-glutamate ligase [Candidatus Saccharibacteria bacterium]|nr:UDP-N-acetylmuramoyl-L-alanine--D-glutamate ligase [Candidatus Saccharibacteria bacterium]